MRKQGLGRAGVRRLLSEQIKRHGPEGLWYGLGSACVSTLWAIGGDALLALLGYKSR